MTQIYDIAVVGAGMAGASVAAELAGEASVLLIEREAQPGYHSTGRSAAVYAPTYGPGPIRALTRASWSTFNAPPEGFTPAPLLSPRAAIFVARADQTAALAALWAELGGDADIAALEASEVETQLPLLKPGYAAAGLMDTGSYEIDVAALHQAYLRQVRARGGTILVKAEVSALARQPDHWRIETGAGPVRAKTIVNAAGAWADMLGAMAGAETIGLVPKRRTALIVPAPDGVDTDAMPMIVDAEEQFYIKPDAGKLLISPANEDPVPPCDVQPEEMDIALCIDRVERACTLQVRWIEARWAGLRSFVPDKCPVVGYSQTVADFFWLAGQGGYGIQTAPALSKLAASMLLDRPMPSEIAQEGVRLSDLAPERLAPA